jgi:hypothetical protein
VHIPPPDGAPVPVRKKRGGAPSGPAPEGANCDCPLRSQLRRGAGADPPTNPPPAGNVPAAGRARSGGIRNTRLQNMQVTNMPRVSAATVNTCLHPMDGHLM